MGLIQDKVTTKWVPNNRKYYEDIGYTFTKYYEDFEVKVEDLPEKSGVRLLAKCDCCGEVIGLNKQSYTLNIEHNNGAYLCKTCSIRKTFKKKNRPTAEREIQLFYDWCNIHDYTPLSNIDDYKSVKSYLFYICPEHGKMHTVMERVHQGSICGKCAKHKYGRYHTKPIDDVIREVESKNNNKLLNPEDYIDTTTRNLRIVCGSCGQEFITSLASIKGSYGHCYSCGQKYSQGEDLIETFLINHEVQYEPQKKFEDCRDKRVLPFDFYLPEYMTCIEFDGQGHYQPVFGDKSFERTVLHDKMKNKYCEENGIKLIRIPYWDGNNINEILSKELNIA